MIAPWLLKNWIYLQNPVAPFFNRLFPNPYVTLAFEDTYRRMMAIYHLKSRWQIPMDVTTYGSISGLLGPVFLLSPLALLSSAPSRRAPTPAGRARLRRELLQQYRRPIPASAAAVRRTRDDACRERHTATRGGDGADPLRDLLARAGAALCAAAMRGGSPNSRGRKRCASNRKSPTWNRACTDYGVDRMIERNTPPGATVFTFTPIPGGLHVAPHPRGIPGGAEPDRGQDSVDRDPARIRAHLASALRLPAPETPRPPRGADRDGRRFLERPRTAHPRWRPRTARARRSGA